MITENRRGRPAKDTSPLAVLRRAEASRRFKEYRLSLGVTQDYMATEILHIELRYLQKIESEKEDMGVSRGVADALEKYSGIVAEYWTGETDIQNKTDYLLEAELNKADREDLQSTENRIQKRFQETITQYECMFAALGYRYKCFADPSSLWDMVIVLSDGGDERPDGEVFHQLTPYKDPGHKFQFGQDRFNEILKHLQDTITFECLTHNENNRYDGYDGSVLSQIPK